MRDFRVTWLSPVGSRCALFLAILGTIGFPTLLFSQGTSDAQFANINDNEANETAPRPNTAVDDKKSTGLGDLDALLDADISQLANTEITAPVFSDEVTTVDRQEGTVGRSPAAVYVITGEMIRRSGVRSIPDALRLAPGVQVAQIDANKWAISIRGFAQRFSNKLLVQIDGRTVYTPLFAGVFWDVQDVLLEDVDRIEIIRGPGASVWGANAVNGVINIITKHSEDTQGIFAEAGGGNERGFASARIGGGTEDVTWRAFGKWFDRDAGYSATLPTSDDMELGHMGFRSDWQASSMDTVTAQGDYYDGNAGTYQFQPLPGPPYITTGADNQSLTGGNALLRWTRQIDETSNWSLQLYYDHTDRHAQALGFREQRDTVDVDFQRQFQLGQWHAIIYGMGYRNSSDQIQNSPFSLQFYPEKRSINRYSTFIQDRMTLLEDKLYFTAGSKFSWNDLTHFEIQPTARLLYTPSNRKSIWASVSRAVRVPSRSSDNIHLVMPPTSTPVFPTYPSLIGNTSVESEDLLAWEFGIRSAPTDDFFWDLALFYNQYDDLQSFAPGIPGVDPISGVFALPLNFINGESATSYGFELASTWEVDACWTLRGGYSFLRLDVDSSAGGLPPTTPERDDPRNQLFMHSSRDLGNDWQWDLMGRYVDTLAGQGIPSYFELDTRVAWRPTDTFEFSLVGRNLLDHAHSEFGHDAYAGVFATEVQRELYGVATWRY